MEIGMKTAVALLALIAFVIHDIVGMSEEIKNNLTKPTHEIRNQIGNR